MKNSKKQIKNESIKTPEVPKAPAMRQIIIETNGNDIRIVKAEVSGGIELQAILIILLENLKNKKA